MDANGVVAICSKPIDKLLPTLLCLTGFFTLLREKWWRRRESNPSPSVLCLRLYMLSLSII